MRVLSLFDGISCGRLALSRAGITPSIYYAAEVDRHAISVTQRNWPETVQVGDVRGVLDLICSGEIGDIDLVIGGSPCQGFSVAGKNKGFDDPRSKLLLEYVAIKNALNPRWFLLENVPMAQADAEIVERLTGVRHAEIDSRYFSAQSRKRWYWTNIPVAPIIDRGCSFADIMDRGSPRMSKVFVKRKTTRKTDLVRLGHFGKGYQGQRVYSALGKYPTLVLRGGGGPALELVSVDGETAFMPSVLEAERLQTLPDRYTEGLPRTRAFRSIGNGWTVDVIAHIFRGMTKT